MTRRHADRIDVVRRDEAPEQFLWRSRLYLVREVLAHWTEAGRWWRSRPDREQVLDDREREFWRVEAAAGSSSPPGVYDLCFDWSRNSWHLATVLD